MNTHLFWDKAEHADKRKLHIYVEAAVFAAVQYFLSLFPFAWITNGRMHGARVTNPESTWRLLLPLVVAQDFAPSVMRRTN